MKKSKILFVDAVVNLILGILLLAFSPGIINFLGVPNTELYFYPNILGGVLFGVGIALLIEYYRKSGSLVGLGLGGAVSINICGGIVLALWLVFGNLSIPLKGIIFLWILVVILVGISSTELLFYKHQK
jgi:uncharacterized membrane protein